MLYKVYGFLVFGFLIDFVELYRNGMIIPACDDMKPDHKNYKAQESAPPYKVFASKYSFSPGDQITVTLLAEPNVTFEGFLLQARTQSGGNLVGSFRVLYNYSQILDCGGIRGSALSHVNPNKLHNVTAIWTAPETSDNVHFRATFVRGFKTFWVGVESQVLRAIPNTNLPSVPNIILAPPINLPILSTTSTNLPLSSNENQSNLFSKALCGTEKVCFSIPADCEPASSNGCFFMSCNPLPFASGGGYQFEISGQSDGYVSIGFSDDTNMGNDDIYICVRNAGGMIEVLHAYSEGQFQPRILIPSNVEIKMASFNNGIIQCSFIARNISIQTLSRKLDLYYIFLAFGASNGGIIQNHGPRGRFISNSKMNLLVPSRVQNSQSGVSSLVKAHGALMLIAWMTTGSLGMILARYFKATASELVLGKPIWFQGHFFLMVLTVCTTIAAFVLAFVQVRGWSYATSTHSIIGCIVMILAFFQPIIALFRPLPQSNRRFIFNWFHTVNAVVIKALAVANIFLGLEFIAFTYPWLPQVMGGFVGWEALALIAHEINAQRVQKEKESWDVNGDSKSNNLLRNHVFIFFIYLCGNLAFLITLLVGIGKS